MPKFCPECGAEIKYRDAKFCPECGFKLKVDEAVEEEYPVKHEKLERSRRKQVKRSNEWAMMSAVSATLGIISLYFWNFFKGLWGIRPLTPVMFYFGIFLFIIAIISGAFSLRLRRRGLTTQRGRKKRGKLLVGKKFKFALLTIVGVTAVVIVLMIDWDRDGLATFTEHRLGTNPFNPNSDTDGLNDGLEVNTYGTNPLDADTDADGLNDGLEVIRYETNPLVADTDGDGLRDDLEVNGWSITAAGISRYITSNPISKDSDGDGLSDKEEYSVYHTDTLSTDTDSDGLSDWSEIMTYKTDPLTIDSDADGLKDGAEINSYHTNSLKLDTDYDGLPDGLEVNTLASNPLRMDIFVEVDWMSTLEPSVISRLIMEFADAPIKNPDGSTGITLNIDLGQQVPTISEISSAHENGDLNDFYDYKERYFSRRKGFHYALICNAVKNDSQVGGVALNFDFMVATQSNGYLYPSDVIGSNFMHELGHAIGLHSSVYKGIDSHEVPFSDYQSVMNYNKPSDYYGYSSRGAFSDWNYLQEHGLEAPVDINCLVMSAHFPPTALYVKLWRKTSLFLKGAILGEICTTETSSTR
jgi:hypothetical protein